MALQLFSYPLPPSSYLNITTVISLVTVPRIGLSEVLGIHLQYSKFWNVNPKINHFGTVSSRTGMFVLYFPALLASLASFALFDGVGGLRFLLLRLAITVHFLKRVLEVLFIHKFSARVGVHTMILVSFGYFTVSASTIYSLHLSETHFPGPLIDLTYPGLVLFLVGIGGNLYHHLLLSRLRGKGEMEGYKIPRGGMFDLVICPHYLFEIIDFIGIAFMGQTPYSYVVAVDTIWILVGRSYATRKWYKSKFEDFPESVKALVPYIF